jgi:glutaminyl-peptide cyclotransferase
MTRGSPSSRRLPANRKRALGAALAACALALASSAFDANAADHAAGAAVATYGYDIVNTWPHDSDAFTQGLAFKDGILYESTGGYGASSLRAIDLDSGSVRRRIDLPRTYFAEGIAILGDRIYQLTWREHKGFIYDLRTFAPLGGFDYDGEGWGLTTDGVSLIMSDGTDRLRFLDPQTFRVRRMVLVRANAKPLLALNELEFFKGEILANVWQRDVIARIDPRSGTVRGWIDLTGLQSIKTADAVLNGIAYDEERGRLLVTGKLWPTIFQIRLRERARR